MKIMVDKILRLIEMAENLMNDPTIEVIYFDYQTPPIPHSETLFREEMKYIENTYLLKLPHEIRSFYEFLSEFHLLWIDKSNPEYKPSQHFYQQDFDLEEYLKRGYWKNGFPVDGCINIWPIGDAFARNWDEHITFEEEKEQSVLIENTQYNLYDVKKRFIPFDLFSKDDCVGFYNSITTNTVDKIIYASDNYISFRDSKSLTMQQYLDLLIKSKGRIDDRQMPFRGGRGFMFPAI